MHYRKATIEDIDFLVRSRLEFTYGMRRMEEAASSAEYQELEENCYQYFRQALTENACDVILVETDGDCIGTGIIFYYLSVPSVFNPQGRNAYITSLYVNPDFRKQGIGSAIVQKLMETAAERGFQVVMLNASKMGMPMYEKLGFQMINNGMIYDGRKL